MLHTEEVDMSRKVDEGWWQHTAPQDQTHMITSMTTSFAQVSSESLIAMLGWWVCHTHLSIPFFFLHNKKTILGSQGKREHWYGMDWCRFLCVFYVVFGHAYKVSSFYFSDKHTAVG